MPSEAEIEERRAAAADLRAPKVEALAATNTYRALARELAKAAACALAKIFPPKPGEASDATVFKTARIPTEPSRSYHAWLRTLVSERADQGGAKLFGQEHLPGMIGLGALVSREGVPWEWGPHDFLEGSWPYQHITSGRVLGLAYRHGVLVDHQRRGFELFREGPL